MKLTLLLFLLITLSTPTKPHKTTIKEALLNLMSLKSYDDFFPEKTEYGYIPIRQNGSKFFYWMCPSRSNPDTDPLVFWFQGGPGCSSCGGLFFEQGPFFIQTEGDLKATLRPIAWNQKANIVFVDNPLGTGFSIASPGEEPQNREDVQRDILEFFKNWIELDQFKKFKGRPLYITGESYGGHWVPYISNVLYKEKNPDLNIKGLAIGNGCINAADTYGNYPDFSVKHPDQTGVTLEVYQKIKPVAQLCAHFVKNTNPLLTYTKDKICSDRVEDAINIDPVTHIQKFNVYNIYLKNDYPDTYTAFLNNPGVQKVLGVDKKWEDCGDEVYNTFYKHDWYLDASPYLRELLEDKEFKVWWYNGDYDFICNWLGEQETILDISWNQQGEWAKVEWEDCAYGQCKTMGNVRFIKFHAAGHMVPHDQIKLSTDMLNEFIGVGK